MTKRISASGHEILINKWIGGEPQMVDRRSVLKAGAASVAGALVSMSAPVLGAAWADAPNLLYGAVFAPRFQQAVAFAKELRRSMLLLSGSEMTSLSSGIGTCGAR